MFDHESGFVLPIAGARIYVETHGNDAAPVLLLLHGGLGTIEDFNPFLAHWRDGFRLVGIDTRGHGRSTLSNEALSYERLEQDALAVLDHLEISNAGVLGFSDGGIVGYRLATRRPRRVRSLISIGASYDLRAGTREKLAKVTPESWKQKFPDTLATYQRCNPAADFDALVGAAVGMWLDTGSTGHPGESVSRIEAPTLIVRGDEDHLFALEEAGSLRSLIHGAKLLNVPMAGHVAHSDQPRVCSEVFAQFLATIDYN